MADSTTDPAAPPPDPNHCVKCGTKFVRSVKRTTNPRAESCIHPRHCKRCSSANLAALDPPMTFAEMVERCSEARYAS